MAATLLGAIACGGSLGSDRPRPPSQDDAAIAGAAALWMLPAGEMETQRLVRLRYDGPRDDGTLYLTLRLESPSRYTLEAHSRLLGKSVFRLLVRDERALYLDLQRSEYCRFDHAIEIAAVPLGPLPFDVLPALLLGLVPTRPDGAGAQLDEDGGWSFRDREGRRWTVVEEGGLPQSWTLWREETPSVWWSREGDMSYLSAPEEELQLRWRAGAAEPLATELATPVVPEGFVPGTDCG